MSTEQDEQKARVMTRGDVWSVWLSPEATVVELAAIMGGLSNGGIETKAEHMGGGAFAIFPVLAFVPAPSGEFIATCLQDFPSHFPTLVAKR